MSHHLHLLPLLFLFLRNLCSTCRQSHRCLRCIFAHPLIGGGGEEFHFSSRECGRIPRASDGKGIRHRRLRRRRFGRPQYFRPVEPQLGITSGWRCVFERPVRAQLPRHSVVVKMTPTKTKTLSRPESIEIKTRPRLEKQKKNDPYLPQSQVCKSGGKSIQVLS